MLDANSAIKIREVKSAWKIAVISCVMGVIISLFTLYLALGLFFNRKKLGEMVAEDDDDDPS